PETNGATRTDARPRTAAAIPYQPRRGMARSLLRWFRVEPLLVDAVVRPVALDRRERLVDRRPQVRVPLAHSDPVLLLRPDDLDDVDPLTARCDVVRGR